MTMSLIVKNILSAKFLIFWNKNYLRPNKRSMRLLMLGLLRVYLLELPVILGSLEFLRLLMELERRRRKREVKVKNLRKKMSRLNSRGICIWRRLGILDWERLERFCLVILLPFEVCYLSIFVNFWLKKMLSSSINTKF